jgi:hypothetical protein
MIHESNRTQTVTDAINSTLDVCADYIEKVGIIEKGDGTEKSYYAKYLADKLRELKQE